MEHQVSEVGEELLDLAGTDADVDMNLELSFQRLVQVFPISPPMQMYI